MAEVENKQTILIFHAMLLPNKLLIRITNFVRLMVDEVKFMSVCTLLTLLVAQEGNLLTNFF